MNEAVTYADLQFVNLSLKDCQNSEAEDNEEEDGAMYENVNPNLNIPSRRAQNSAQGNRGQVAGGPLKLASNLTLFLLLLCLVLLASMIGTTIKYFQVSRELQDISTIYIELNSSLSQAIQHKEEELTLTYRALTNSQNELKQLVENHKNLNRTLHLCQVTEQQTNEKLADMERLYSETMVKNQQVMEEKQEIQIHLEDKDNQLRLLNEEICPDKWIRFGMRCLYFSEEEKQTWVMSKIFCENQKASLLLLRNDDWKLKEFITKKQNDYWVGTFDYYEPKEFLR
ncbi:B-cell differentiation antigen CD72-like [Xenopus laevis]|uniref:B-cell differentiation antigen CD72-like n=1 Tax=Xenopus laevis TaxID=8355 RepID=A0A8J1LW35_XENLA|nr:B-cell differentiation antigen CD72-like [Xenopus laevis]